MSSFKISQAEANRLIAMLKHSLVSDITFPSRGKDTEFNVIGDKKQNVFSINIFREKSILLNIT